MPQARIGGELHAPKPALRRLERALACVGIRARQQLGLVEQLGGRPFQQAAAADDLPPQLELRALLLD